MVLQSIPTYAMRFFHLPVSLCLELNSMMSNFWWGQRGEEQKLHWISWKKLCKPKICGGMGFRDLQFFNQALLAKQGWRILTSPDTLLHKVLKCKYFPNCFFMEATIPSYSSYTWRQSIAQSRDIIRHGSR